LLLLLFFSRVIIGTEADESGSNRREPAHNQRAVVPFDLEAFEQLTGL
jgi:hypothetical protein